MRDDLVGDLEGLVGVEPQELLGLGDLIVAERAAVSAAGVHLVWRGVADDGAQDDDRRLVDHCLCLLDSLLDRGDVLAALDVLNVPTVCLIASGDVLGQRDVGVVLDRDVVLVVEHDEVAELLGACQRAGLRRDALFDVAIGRDHVDVVVERALADRGIRVEQSTLVARGHRHPYRRRQSLTERPGGHLHTARVAVLRMAGRLGLIGAQRLEIVELEAESAEVELDVQRQARVTAGQDEAVAAHPVRIRGVMPHHTLEQRVGQGRQAHGCSGVSTAAFLNSVCGQNAHRVNGFGVHLAPVSRV